MAEEWGEEVISPSRTHGLNFQASRTVSYRACMPQRPTIAAFHLFAKETLDEGSVIKPEIPQGNYPTVKDNLWGKCQVLPTHCWEKAQDGWDHECGLLGVSKARKAT